MRHLKQLLSVLTVSLVASTVLTSSAFAEGAKIIKIIGNAQAATITRDGATIPMTEGMAIQVKDVINTGAGVDVYVQPYSGVVATLKPNSHASLSMLAADDAELDLTLGGSLVAQIEPNKGHKFGVRTPKGVAAARGTVFTVTNSGGTFSVSVLGGVVTVTPLINGVSQPAVPVSSGNSSDNAQAATALSAKSPAEAGAIAAAAMEAVAVVAAAPAGTYMDTGSSAALLNQTMATVVAVSSAQGNSGAGSVLAQAVAAATAAAPSQVGEVVTAALNSGTAAEKTAIANTVTQAAAEGAGQAAAKSAASGSTNATQAVDAAKSVASEAASAATTALKAAGVTGTALSDATKSIAVSATVGATEGVTTTAFGATGVNNSGNSVNAQIAGSAASGANSGANLSTATGGANVGQTNVAAKTQEQAPNATPITPIDPSINVSPSGGG